MLHITERMVTLAKSAGKHRFAADIGTDHGYLAMHLVRSGLAQYVYAIDNKEGPAAKARRNIAEEGLGDSVRCIVADGFDGLRGLKPTEMPGAVFIAGIGGIVTAEILERGMDVVSNVDRLVLQPANREDALREFLYSRKMKILDEYILADAGRYFVVFVVDPREIEEHPRGKFDILYGRFIPFKRDCITGRYLQRKLHFVREALAQLEESIGQEDIKESMGAHMQWLQEQLARFGQLD